MVANLELLYMHDHSVVITHRFLFGHNNTNLTLHSFSVSSLAFSSIINAKTFHLSLRERKCVYYHKLCTFLLRIGCKKMSDAPELHVEQVETQLLWLKAGSCQKVKRCH